MFLGQLNETPDAPSQIDRKLAAKALNLARPSAMAGAIRLFKSQAVLDEQALAACMAYVHLNSIRANVARTLEESVYISAKKRITEVQKTPSESTTPHQPKTLFPFVGNPR